jgi:hypothetical protein
MKRLAIILLLCTSALASTVYVSQAGGTYSGTSDAYCTNGTTSTITPASITWTAGNTYVLCGTFSYSPGSSSAITVGASGSSGNVITLLCGTSNNLTATYWSTAAINLSAHSYITVNGCTIQATANGTSLTNQQDNGECISNGSPAGTSSNVTVENITCVNLYVHTCGSPISTCTDEGGQDTYCFDLWNITTLVIQNSTCHDANTGIRNSYATGNTYSSLTVTGITGYNLNHDWFITDSSSSGTATLSGVYVYGNVFHDWQNWDDYNGGGTPQNHHDCLILSTNSSSSVFTSFYIYNNQCYGNIGYAMSGIVFSFPATPAAISGVYVFNNVFNNTATTYCTADGLNDWINNNVTLVNNTFLSSHTSCAQFSGQNEAGYTNGNGASAVSGVTNENNIFVNTNAYALQWGSHAPTGTIVSNYNDYYENGDWLLGSNSYSSLSSWTTATTYDANSITTNPNLNGSYVPNSGSPVIATGTNLYSTCNGQANPGLGALCSDANGNARPSSGNWTMGALSAASGPGVAPGRAIFVF